MKPTAKHCAIYTRKSAEEGLEQEFNTLDAQRETCLSFVASQREEGWMALPDQYDDGGYTGGNIDRPGLQQLLADIQAGKVSIVVVYKIDRLTRSLMDFSKLVEIFDQYDVTFVSITQSFNTTTSMGRLTLNVLLSFAQFEREVIGERVRDKIAASKKKGMWMGGNNPVGYQRINKMLVPKDDEAEFVKMIFERYLEFGCARRLAQHFRAKGVRSRKWTSSKGVEHGGSIFSRGALYTILSNPVYIGKIRHKKAIYDGQHPPIIERELWDRVQKKLKDNKASASAPTDQHMLLQGKIFDREGTLYGPTYTVKDGKRYPYYVSRNIANLKDHPDGLRARLPAGEFEELVRDAIKNQGVALQSLADLLNSDVIAEHDILNHIARKFSDLDIDKIIRKCCTRISLSSDAVKIGFRVEALRSQIKEQLRVEINTPAKDDAYEISMPYILSRTRRGAITIGAPRPQLASDDPFNDADHRIQNWVKGVAWREMHFQGKTIAQIAAKEGVGLSYVSRLIDQSFEMR